LIGTFIYKDERMKGERATFCRCLEVWTVQ